MNTTRRRFLQTAAGAASLGLPVVPPLGELAAFGAAPPPATMRFGPDIEPVVRLIEDTPRDNCIAMMIDQLKKGLPYRNFLAALYLANIRTGLVDHPLAVLHSTNQLTLDLPVQERLLPTYPTFWAMDGTTAPAIGSSSVTKRSGLPTAGESWRRSAGSTPSRSSASC